MSMDGDQHNARWWKTGAGTTVLIFVAVALFIEFHDPAAPLWTAFLFIVMAALVIAALLLMRRFALQIDEVGEARFDTRNKEE